MTIAEQRFDFVDVDPKESALDVQFSEWLAKHDVEYRRIAKLALRAVTAGRRHLSAKGLVELARSDPEYLNSARWKLDNSLTSRLARKLVEDYPQLKGVFEFRRLKAAK